MAQGSDVEGPNVAVSSHPFTVETTTIQRKRSTGTIICPPSLPTLPFDLLPEILCRLPVKLLVQLRCLCKFFNSLISDPKFAKKHLQFSTKCYHLMVTSRNNLGEYVQYDSPIPSILSTSAVVTQTQLYPTNGRKSVWVTCSCDGMFCGELNLGSYFVWNPSIRTFKLLPPFENPRKYAFFCIGFGYDCFIDNYKVIVVSTDNEVSVNILGTDYWTRIEDIPYSYRIYGPGVFVSGNVNWLVSDSSMHFILSLDLENESYQQLLLPNSNYDSSILGLVRDCLCVSTSSDMFLDVWIMKEYGNQESWTKLHIVPDIQDQGFDVYKALYISEDDQLLVEFDKLQSENIKLVVYDSKTGTLNIPEYIPEFQNNYKQVASNVYIESLISP